MEKNWVIEQAFDSGVFLDGFDGTEYEWTTVSIQAWRFTLYEATRRLEQVKQKWPNALVTEL